MKIENHKAYFELQQKHATPWLIIDQEVTALVVLSHVTVAVVLWKWKGHMQLQDQEVTLVPLPLKGETSKFLLNWEVKEVLWTPQEDQRVKHEHVALQDTLIKEVLWTPQEDQGVKHEHVALKDLLVKEVLWTPQEDQGVKHAPTALQDPLIKSVAWRQRNLAQK